MFLPFKLFKLELVRQNSYKEYIQYINVINKYDKCESRIAFLERCRDSDIIPNFLNFRIPNNGCFEDQSVHDFQRRLLHKEINKAKRDLKCYEQSVNSKRNNLIQSVPNKCLPSVIFHSRHARKTNRQCVKLRHTKKLSVLSQRQNKPLFNVKNTIRVFEFDKHIPLYVKETLSLGPRNPILDKFNDKEVLTELDCFLKYCVDHNVPDPTITDINIKTLHYIKTCKNQKTPRHINMTKKFLEENKLVAVPFDKGIGFCLMPRKSYEDKLNPIINLPQFQKYEVKRKNAKHPVLKEEERVIETLSKLKKEGKIDEEMYKSLKPVGSQAPRLYGLAKVHKEDVPLRPIVSMPGSPYHRIAKQVADWLSLVPECKINSSTMKINKALKDISLNENECLVSFDVVSLYTNVPVDEAIHVCAELLFKHVCFETLDKETFITLAKLACKDTVFSSHDGYYVQIDGLAMGSPPAPHLANGWLNSFEKSIQGTSSFYFRYMDDVICTINKDEINDRLKTINNLHPCLTFTHELEQDGKIPFLDMWIINKGGKLSSKWYRKPTDTGLVLNFHSLAPLKYKKSVVISFVRRIYTSSSSWQFFHEALDEAKEILTNNQYPISFVEEIINVTLGKLVGTDKDENVDNNDTMSEENNISIDSNAYILNVPNHEKFNFFVTYRGKPTDALAHKFRKLNLPCKIVMTMRKMKTILPSLKPQIPRMLQSNVVYKINCPGCMSSYVGQTTRHLLRRFKEHTGNTGPVKSHLESCNVTPDENMISVIGKSQNLPKLLTLEALYIREINPSLNTKDEYRSRTLTLKF